jgi:hypothetical protein
MSDYYIRNKERIQQQRKAYYQMNREERLAYQHEYNMLTEAERKQKNKQRYWATRDKAKKAKPPPRDFPVDYLPASFSVQFE